MRGPPPTTAVRPLGRRWQRDRLPDRGRPRVPPHDALPPGAAAAVARDSLPRRVALELAFVRTRSLTLTDLSDDDLCKQHSSLMSPLVWDLAHVGNYEDQWLLRAVDSVHGCRPDLDDLYDAFRHPRDTRRGLAM